MAGLRALSATDTAQTVELRASIEQSALAVDDRLVAISVLAPAQRASERAAAAQAVDLVEAAVAEYARAATGYATTALERDLADVRAHLDTLAEVRRQLDQR